MRERPLAIAVVGGLMMSTFLTLFVVPCTYLIVHGIGDRVKALLYGKASGDSAPVAESPLETGR